MTTQFNQTPDEGDGCRGIILTGLAMVIIGLLILGAKLLGA